MATHGEATYFARRDRRRVGAPGAARPRTARQSGRLAAPHPPAGPGDRVLAVDRPGYGASGPEAVGLLENAEPARGAAPGASAVGATVVGHSPGAGIALAMAERSLGAGALVLIGAAGVDGTVGMLDHLLALPLFATVGVTGVRRVAARARVPRTGPVGARDRGLGARRRGAASRSSSAPCCASGRCSRPPRVDHRPRRPSSWAAAIWSSARRRSGPRRADPGARLVDYPEPAT